MISFSERVVGSGVHKDEIIKVNVPTHVNGILEFVSGAVGTITTSFDVWGSEHRNLEIYGSEGTLLVPDMVIAVTNLVVTNRYGLTIKAASPVHGSRTGNGFSPG